MCMCSPVSGVVARAGRCRPCRAEDVESAVEAIPAVDLAPRAFRSAVQSRLDDVSAGVDDPDLGAQKRRQVGALSRVRCDADDVGAAVLHGGHSPLTALLLDDGPSDDDRVVAVRVARAELAGDLVEVDDRVALPGPGSCPRRLSGAGWSNDEHDSTAHAARLRSVSMWPSQ